MDPLQTALSRHIAAATGRPFRVSEARQVAGGCINTAAVICDARGQRYFVKLNHAARAQMFAAEAEGLDELERARAIRVPRTICVGTDGDRAFLVLEYLQLGGDADEARLGQQLAALHRTQRPQFGWHRDNTIGATPQVNAWCRDWIEFWRERRLRPQLALASGRGAAHLAPLGAALLEQLPQFFTGYQPQASLLHGDLWAGNAATLLDGDPALFDPAVYFGDREADLAMTELFGGFGTRFHDAYRDAWPLDPGYRVRKTLYNLYHILNHFNLFGGGYASQAERMLNQLLAELR